MSGETNSRNTKASDGVVAPDFPVEASASLPAEWQNSNSIAALIRRHTQGWLITSTNVASIGTRPRSEEHTSELQSLMRISYAVFCLKKKNKRTIQERHINLEHQISARPLLHTLTTIHRQPLT